MDLAGDLVQSLGNYLGLEDLTSTANFPTELARLETLLSRSVRVGEHLSSYIVGFFKIEIRNFGHLDN